MTAEIIYLHGKPKPEKAEENHTPKPEDAAAHFVAQLFNAVHFIPMQSVHYLKAAQVEIEGKPATGREALHQIAQRICKIIHHIDTGVK